jgi:hypothetical protein|tara:strand:+ start:128 stop:484 length:357 start_codon:yes stop_codon:yes gene_type:complete
MIKKVFTYVKKYFLFDNESLTGGLYLIRWIIGVSLAYIGIGFWILAASAYKRAGTFRWNKNLRVISAILILGSPFSSLLSEAKSSSFSISPLLQIFLLLAAFVHCVLLFKDGNKSLIN